MKEIEIKERSTLYEVTGEYHSDLMCQNYNGKIFGTTEADNRISIKPGDGCGDGFEFFHSDPDRVIAVAQMILSFAQMAKKENMKQLTQAQTNDSISI